MLLDPRYRWLVTPLCLLAAVVSLIWSSPGPLYSLAQSYLIFVLAAFFAGIVWRTWSGAFLGSGGSWLAGGTVRLAGQWLRSGGRAVGPSIGIDLLSMAAFALAGGLLGLLFHSLNEPRFNRITLSVTAGVLGAQGVVTLLARGAASQSRTNALAAAFWFLGGAYLLAKFASRPWSRLAARAGESVLVMAGLGAVLHLLGRPPLP